MAVQRRRARARAPQVSLGPRSHRPGFRRRNWAIACRASYAQRTCSFPVVGSLSLDCVSKRRKTRAPAFVRSIAIACARTASTAAPMTRSSSFVTDPRPLLAFFGLGGRGCGGCQFGLELTAQAAESFTNGLFQALLRGLVEARSDELIGQVGLARHEAAVAVGRILIALAVAFGLHQPRNGIA